MLAFLFSGHHALNGEAILMDEKSFRIVGNKVIVNVRRRVCENADELLTSDLFMEVTRRCISDLAGKQSILMKLFDGSTFDDSLLLRLIEAFRILSKVPIRQASASCVEAEPFFRDPALLSRFVEHLYNFWRGFDRFVICDSEGDVLDKRPYRTFNDTLGKLTHLIRAVYRDIEENITGDHPRIYRQVSAGAEVVAISLPKRLSFPGRSYEKLTEVPVIRQILINPPLILNPPITSVRVSS
jgi:hypothetical protein